ncbi:hypothetical protein V5N11_013595 [Cardamine amara subsp. amara]|uniref:PLATZ transcription factor family protein n=1 Tax=Cardamine amara subsp. amara TaxID=228776 RepID=A0ABD1BM38_CARAN
MVETMQETIEVQSCIRNYPWLIQMVKSKQFHELCDQHIEKKRCYFCCDCMVPPLCKDCYKDSDHKAHNTIQTYRSSHQTGVRKDVILRYMSISGIQLYTINGRYIVYINQRRDSTENRRLRNNLLHKCQVCEWELDAGLFCSIECKFRNTLGSQLDELMENNSEISEISSEDVVVEPVKKKRHRRKGIPHRSPFF